MATLTSFSTYFYIFPTLLQDYMKASLNPDLLISEDKCSLSFYIYEVCEGLESIFCGTSRQLLYYNYLFCTKQNELQEIIKLSPEQRDARVELKEVLYC